MARCSWRIELSFRKKALSLIAFSLPSVPGMTAAESRDNISEHIRESIRLVCWKGNTFHSKQCCIQLNWGVTLQLLSLLAAVAAAALPLTGFSTVASIYYAHLLPVFPSFIPLSIIAGSFPRSRARRIFISCLISLEEAQSGDAVAMKANVLSQQRGQRGAARAARAKST